MLDLIKDYIVDVWEGRLCSMIKNLSVPQLPPSPSVLGVWSMPLDNSHYNVLMSRRQGGTGYVPRLLTIPDYTILRLI